MLALAGAGGAVLQWLGPPPDRASAGDAQTVQPSASNPAEPRPAVPPPPASAAQTVAEPEPPAPQSPAPQSPGMPSSPPAVSSDAAGIAQQDGGKTAIAALVIRYAGNSDSSRAAAEQLAARAGVPPDQIEARATADVPSSGIIRFYAREDHAWARRLGQELSDMGYTWRIQNLSGRVAPAEHPSVEVSLPERRRSP